jgi:hypothetical protein
MNNFVNESAGNSLPDKSDIRAEFEKYCKEKTGKNICSPEDCMDCIEDWYVKHTVPIKDVKAWIKEKRFEVDRITCNQLLNHLKAKLEESDG